MVRAAFAKLGDPGMGRNAIGLGDLVNGPLEPCFQMDVDLSLNDAFVVIGAQLRAGEVVFGRVSQRRCLRGTQVLCNSP